MHVGCASRHAYIPTVSAATHARWRHTTHSAPDLSDGKGPKSSLEPVGMSHALYVVARDVGVNELRTFKVERIRHISPTAEAFTIPDTFDPVNYFASSWSVWEDEPIEVVVRFSALVAPHVQEAHWHSSQQITYLPDGQLLWQAHVAGTIEIVSWIRSWGPEAEVLAPLALREQLAEESRRQALLYASTAL